MKKKKRHLPWKFISLQDYRVNALSCQSGGCVRASWAAANDENRALRRNRHLYSKCWLRFQVDKEWARKYNSLLFIHARILCRPYGAYMYLSHPTTNRVGKEHMAYKSSYDSKAFISCPMQAMETIGKDKILCLSRIRFVTHVPTSCRNITNGQPMFVGILQIRSKQEISGFSANLGKSPQTMQILLK